MDLGLKNKVVIVTGGAAGIGEAITAAIAQERGIPIIADRSENTGNNMVEQLSAKGHQAHFVKAELTIERDCRKIVEQTVTRYGRIDALINNAGVNDKVGLEKGSLSAFKNSLENNLFHCYQLAQMCLPQLKKNQGSILNISSKVAVTGQGETSGYAASKGALLALTREWAVELLPYNIRVNAILPAEVMTPLYEQWINTFERPKEKLEEIKERIPLGKRMTTTSEIAAMAAFLISQKASHVTGQHLYVDGGHTHLDRTIK